MQCQQLFLQRERHPVKAKSNKNIFFLKSIFLIKFCVFFFLWFISIPSSCLKSSSGRNFEESFKLLEIKQWSTIALHAMHLKKPIKNDKTAFYIVNNSVNAKVFETHQMQVSTFEETVSSAPIESKTFEGIVDDF